MRVLTIATALALLAAVTTVNYTYAESAACSTTAGEKKLAGAAKTSFMKKCVTDSCNAEAKGRSSTAPPRTASPRSASKTG